MRTAARLIVPSLVVLGLATSALAQPSPGAAAPAAPVPATVPAAPAPAAEAPATTAPTAPAPNASAPAAPSAPVPPADATAATPVAEAPPPPPSLPTTGDGAVILSLLEKVCVPMVRGGNFDALAKAAGMKKNRRDGSYVIGLGGDKTYTVTIFPPGSNKDVCQGEVHYALGQDKPIVSAINIWAFLHEPELILQANYVNVDPDGVKRVRKSWEHLETNSSIAVNFSTWRKPDDTPLNAKYDTGSLFYQERTF